MFLNPYFRHDKRFKGLTEIVMFLFSKDRFRAVLYDVVTGDMFEIAILTVIICNMVMMMIQHYGQSAQVSSVLHIL